MIEKYEGLNDQSLELVNNYLVAAGYATTGVCVTENNTTSVYGASDLFDASLELAQPGERYYYCIKKYNGTNLTNYYQVGVFYRFNLPVIGDTANFNVKGTTSNFFAKDDPDYCYTIDGSCVSNPGTNSGTPIQPTTYYTVTFNSDGGSSVGSQRVPSGDFASIPKTPTKEGYEFVEWQYNGSEFDFYTRIYSDINLVAKWKSVGQTTSLNPSSVIPNQYTVRYEFTPGYISTRSCGYDWCPPGRASYITETCLEGETVNVGSFYSAFMDGSPNAKVEGYTDNYGRYRRLYSNETVICEKDLVLRASWRY